MATLLTRTSCFILSGAPKMSCLQRPLIASISTSRPNRARAEDDILRLDDVLAQMPNQSLAETIRRDGLTEALGENGDSDPFGLIPSTAAPPLVKAGEGEPEVRLPRSVQAIYLKPLRRYAQYGVPTCDLQLRSYNVRNLEFFADFAIRAAYYLKLPISGPVPLPRITERWTIPKGNFVHKKTQENFERITMRRLIQVQDGHPDVVEIWLAFLKKYQYYGVGMKANVWDYDKIGFGKEMDDSLDVLKQDLDPKWAFFGKKQDVESKQGNSE